jgi:hypothetical protein
VRYIERQGFPGYWAPIHTNQGIDHNSLIHLSSIGLVVYSGGFLTPNVRLYETPDFEVEYFGDRRTFATSDRDEQKGKYFAVYGYADLTDIGRQLARIAGATPVEGFFDFLESEWAKARITRVS